MKSQTMNRILPPEGYEPGLTIEIVKEEYLVIILG